MKILEYQNGVQDAYNMMPYMFVITRDNYVVYRANRQIYGRVVSDEEYEAIMNTRAYIKDFRSAATDKINEILRQEYTNYIKYDYNGPSLCMLCYFTHGHFKSSERAVHYYRLHDRIDGINSISTWMMRHPHAVMSELTQMMSEFSDVFADDELIK